MNLFKRLFKGLIMSLSMFSNVPVPTYEWEDDAAGYIMVFLPAVGLIISVIVYALWYFLNLTNGNNLLKAVLIVCTYYILTGFLHLDGFMDTCDAILSRRDLDERLRILKDSHTGAFAVISVMILTLINCSGLSAVFDKGMGIVPLCMAFIVSRCFGGIFILTLKPLKTSGLGSFFKDVSGKWAKYILMAVIAILLGVAYFYFQPGVFFALLLAAVSACISAFLVYRNLEGFSGDLAGFSIHVCEAVCIIVLAII